MEPVVAGCVPVSFLAGVAAFGVAQVRVGAAAAWFLAWPAQRLERGWTAAAYLTATQGALRLADALAAISAPAADARNPVGRPRLERPVLANQHGPVEPGLTWT